MIATVTVHVNMQFCCNMKALCKLNTIAMCHMKSNKNKITKNYNY